MGSFSVLHWLLLLVIIFVVFMFVRLSMGRSPLKGWSKKDRGRLSGSSSSPVFGNKRSPASIAADFSAQVSREASQRSSREAGARSVDEAVRASRTNAPPPPPPPTFGP